MLVRKEVIPNNWTEVNHWDFHSNKYMTPTFSLPAIYVLLKMSASKKLKRKNKWGYRFAKDIFKLDRDKLEIVYVGYSHSNVYQRLKNHRKTKDYDFVRFINSPNYSFNRQYMEKWEKKLIRKFKPKYNKTCKDGFFEEESPNANRTSRMEWCNKNKIWYTQVYKRMWDKSHGVESYKIIKILYKRDKRDEPKCEGIKCCRTRYVCENTSWHEIKFSQPHIINDIYYDSLKKLPYIKNKFDIRINH